MGEDVADKRVVDSLAEGSDDALSMEAQTGAVTLAAETDHET